jgi:hypothetical protein
MLNKRQELWPLVVFVPRLIVPVGAVLWAVVNSEWGVIEDGLHPFDNAEQIYLPAGHDFCAEHDLYWLGLDEWPSTEAFYYSPLFAAGVAGIDALLPNSVLLVGLLAHVFMDLIAGPVVFFFLIGAGIVTSRALKVFLVAMLTVLTVGPLMSYTGAVPCYLVFTAIALPLVRRFAMRQEVKSI